MADGPCQAFKRVANEDIDDIVHFLKLAQYEESNHNIVNMIMWQDYYPLWIKKEEHYISLIGKHLGEWFMYMPLCEKEFFLTAIQESYDCLKQANIPIVMSCFTEKEASIVQQVYPNMNVIEDRDGFDYVYETEKMRTFSGKKLQKKRNHLNAFYKIYGHCYSYEDISDDNIPECIAFLDDWKTESDDMMVIEEKKGVVEILKIWDRLPCSGGILRVEGKVEAFIVGSHSTQQMGQINVEKANPSVRGSYQAILKEYIERHLKKQKYLNREDDMGLEALRHAKQAYHPCMMIKKYRIIEE